MTSVGSNGLIGWTGGNNSLRLVTVCVCGVSVVAVGAAVAINVYQHKKRENEEKRLRKHEKKLLKQQLLEEEERLQKERIQRNIKRYEEFLKQQFSDDSNDEEEENVDYESLAYPFDRKDSRFNIEYTTDNDGNIIIKGATIYKLIEKLTEESGRGTQMCGSFLLTYRSFLTPKELLHLLIKRFSVPSPDKFDNEKEELASKNYQKHIRLRVWYVLKYWTENHFYDFEEDQELIHEYREFLLQVLTKEMEKLGSQLVTLLDKQSSKDPRQQSVIFIQSTILPSAILPTQHTGHGGQLRVLDIHPLELARQMTLTEYQLYNKIQPKECLDQCWNKDEKEQRAPHIVTLIERFNQSSRWVVSKIVQEENIQTRAQLIEHFIKIAEECRHLQNFNSMMGIIAGLMGSAVSRLKKTWETVPEDIVHRFENEYSTLFDRNFKILRDAVKQSEPPCLPYIGTYLADLTFIEDGNMNTIANGKLINFEKRIMISKVISDLRVYQQKQYLLCEVPEVRDFIEDCFAGKRIKILDENECYRMSLEREPRQRN